ncbi:serine/threonine protein kinase [Candidatus Eisenbacteria bacterium]|uniref:Serine/threonine protein kinase n=1 Tax=Eiseniibacteriota bacterium TaxID=2212470 RepID=A0ABV6YKH1_UNCEI
MPKQYGPWKIETSLREGGQAHTFIVRHSSSNQIAVLKRIKNLKRFPRLAREVAALQKLSHPQIVTLLDVALKAEKPYYVMEYCKRGSLQDHPSLYIGKPVEAINAFEGVCAAVSSAHVAEVIHRDIKPANILVREDGTLVVADFGLCYMDDGDRLTNAEEAVGPRLFMAPEQENGRCDVVLPTVDAYSLGKLLYWLLRGDGRVFSREVHREDDWDLAKVLKRIEYEHVNRLLDRMIAFKPSDRYPSVSMAQEDAARIRALIEGGYNVVSGKHPQVCIYCGIGKYRQWQDTPTNFGLNAVGSNQWKILCCNYCGNVQLFRLERLETKELWDK